MARNVTSAEDSDKEWMAMIGAVASSVVIFILILLITMPIIDQSALIEDKKAASLLLEHKGNNHFIIKNIDQLNKNIEEQTQISQYIDNNTNKEKKYLITILFSKEDKLSTGASYQNSYIYSKIIMIILRNANIKINNIRVLIKQDNTFQAGTVIADIRGT